MEGLSEPGDLELSCETVSPRKDKGASPMVPQSHGCHNKTCTRTTVDMLTCKGEISWSSQSWTKNYKQVRDAESGGSSLPKG